MNNTKHYLLIAGILVLAACKTKEKAVTTTTTPKETPQPALDCTTNGTNFSAVKAIIEQNCIRCHADLNQYAEAKSIAANGEFLATIKHQRGYPNMPKDAEQLPQATIDLVECWIKNGMKE